MSVHRFEPLNAQSRTYELVLDRLREAIIDGTLPPGEQIKTADIARDMGVSRMPVREALHRLEVEGLVLMQPYRGIIVSPLSVDGVRDAYELLSVIEGLATRKATERITDTACDKLEDILAGMSDALRQENYQAYARGNYSLHSEICDWYENERAQEILGHLWNYVHRLRRVYTASASRLAQAKREHEAIVAALRNRDAARVESIVRQHSLNSLAELLQQIEDDPKDIVTRA
jgi:DNA-binding GntR family transcriptional regulator